MSENLKMSDVMTPTPYVIGIQESLKSASDLMLEKNIRHLPVIEKGTAVSVLSERDIKQAYIAFRVDETDESLTVRDAATMMTYTVSIDEPLEGVASHMAKHHIGSAIVNDGDRLAGIFTVTDACRVLGEILKSTN